jgi:SHNi-TPR
MKLANGAPSSADRHVDVAYTYDKLGDAQLKDGKPDEAVTNYQKSLAIARHLAETDPNNFQSQTDLVRRLQKLATVATGDEKDAATKEAVIILDRLDAAVGSR